MQQKLIEFDELGEFGELGVAIVVDPVIDASSTPDICDAFSEKEGQGEGTQFQMSNLKGLKLF